jgi:hypothetical protein
MGAPCHFSQHVGPGFLQVRSRVSWYANSRGPYAHHRQNGSHRKIHPLSHRRHGGRMDGSSLLSGALCPAGRRNAQAARGLRIAERMRPSRASQHPDTGRLHDSGVNLAPQVQQCGRPKWMVGSTRICASGKIPLVKSHPWRPSRAGNWLVRPAGLSNGFQNLSNPQGIRAGGARRGTALMPRRCREKTGIISSDVKPDRLFGRFRHRVIARCRN